jgi:hypothetical protein
MEFEGIWGIILQLEVNKMVYGVEPQSDLELSFAKILI